MPDKDSLTRLYLSQPAVFADIFNFIIYKGGSVIQPNDLREMDSRLTSINSGCSKQQTTNRYPDIIMSVTAKQDAQRIYMLLCIENQTNVDYAMPVRVMQYDAMKYSHLMSLVEFRRTGLDSSPFTSKLKRGERIPPVITVVMYFGSTPWDGPTSLHEMLDFPDNETKRFVADYPLYIMQPALLSDRARTRFRSDFGKVALFCHHAKNKRSLVKLLKSDQSFMNMAGLTAMCINKLTNSHLPIDDRKETTDMCKAIDDMREESLQKGLKKGRKEGSADEKTENIDKTILYHLSAKTPIDSLTNMLVGIFGLSAREARHRIHQLNP